MTLVSASVQYRNVSEKFILISIINTHDTGDMMERCDFAMADVIKQGILDAAHEDILHVDWQISKTCNYRCSYCFDHNKPVKETYDKPRLFRTVDNILALGRPFYCFRLIGGEPTIFPHLDELVNYIYNKTSQAGILLITNGSRSSNYFSKLLASVPPQHADIHISLHLEFAKTEHIGKVLEVIAEAQQSATVRFMYNPEMKEEAQNFHTFLVNLRRTVPFHANLRALRNPPDYVELDARYSNEDLQWMLEADKKFNRAVKQGPACFLKPDWGVAGYHLDCDGRQNKTCDIPHNEAMRHGLTNFKDYYCCAGTNLLTIVQDFRWHTGTCAALPYKKSTVDSADFFNTSLDEPVRCPYNNCGCDANYVLPKFKDKLSALIYCKNHSQRIEEYKKDILKKRPCLNLTTKQIVTGRLNRMKLLRRGIDRIDPENMVIAVMRICLDDAVMYYKNFEPALTKMPDFVVMDWSGEEDAEIATIQKTENILIQPFASYQSNAIRTLCAFAVPKSTYWEPDGFGTIFHALANNGHQTFLYDRHITSKTWCRTPNPEFLAKRLDDICTVYDALADEESKTTYLQAVKTLVSGDAGYLALSPYPQYEHPMVHAEQADILIEGGGDRGYTTQKFVEQIGSMGKIYAFEPVSASANHCKHIFKNFPQVHVEQLSLWSEASTFHIEDNGGESRLVSKPTERSEECYFIDIDRYLAQKHTPCSIIKLDIEGAEEECLKGALGTIAYNRPKLQISLYHNPDHYLDIPLMLLKKFPDYKLYCGHHYTWYNETCLYAVSPKQRFIQNLVSAPCVKSKISVIVPCYNDGHHLRRCLDSIFLQANAVDLELIVVDDASTDGSQAIIQEYLYSFPTRMRTMRFEENRGDGPARNAGMDMATGEFITFVDADDCIAADFLTQSLEKMQQEQADIVCFDMTLTYEDGRTEHLAVEPGCFSRECSLEQMLLRKVGGYANYARTYRRSMLLQHAVRCAETRVHDDMVFSVQAFYYSNKTIVCSEIGYHRYIRKNSLSRSTADNHIIDSFCNFVCFFTRFFKAYHLDLASKMYRYTIEQLYKWDRIAILNAINKAHELGSLSTLLTEEYLHMLGSSPVVVELLLQDYAHFIYHVSDPKPQLAPGQEDWESLAAAPLPVPSYKPYANADTPSTPEPMLSIIIPNYNKKVYLEECLHSILSQSNENVEVIIIDDCSSDGSYELLQDYADVNPVIRLYRMDTNCKQSACQNVGIQKSRGIYITFVDSDDLVSQTFFNDGIMEMRKHDADMIIFNTEVQFLNGKTCYKTGLIEGVYTSYESLHAYLNGLFPVGAHGKLYKKEFIVENNISFIPNIYHQDHHFLISAFKKIKLCISFPAVQYIIRLSPDSSSRPKKYTWLHVYSGFILYNALEECAKSIKFFDIKNQSNHICWNLENCFLPSCSAYVISQNKFPLSQLQLHKLGSSSFFVQKLLYGLSQYVKKQNNLYAMLSQLHEKEGVAHNFSEIQNPLISVIIPVFNQEAALGRCLDSILNQPLQNFEIILVDDASTDHTPLLCKKYANKDGRIRHYTNKSNRGQGYSRNFAQQKSRGKYITYVDSDDYIHENLLLHGSCILESYLDVDIVIFDDIRVDLNNKVQNKHHFPVGIKSGKKFFYEFWDLKVPCSTVWAKIYRKNFIDKYALHFPEHQWEDTVFIIQAYYYAKNIFFTGLHGYTRVNTPHIASTDFPLTITHRNMSGRFAQLHNFSCFIASLKDAECNIALEKMGRWGVKRLYQTKLFSYITQCENKGIEIPSDVSMKHLIESPYFLKAMLEDYAALYAKHTGYRPQLPASEMLCSTSEFFIANSLITLSDHAEESNLPKVSVIVPAWNVATTLGKCLNSILAQQASFEIILVEDNSNCDSTLLLCKEYASKHSCIRLFQTPCNSGLGVVLNLAMRKAKGKYITFVDSDDWLDLNFLKRAVYELDQHSEAELLVCNIERIFDDKCDCTCIPDTEVDGKSMLEAYVFGRYKHWCKVSTLYRRTFLFKYDIQNGIYINEDEIFILKTFLYAKKIILRSFIGYFYNQKTKQTSLMKPKYRGKKYFESTIYNIIEISKFFNDHPEICLNVKNYRLKSFRWGHHRDNLLHYIYACKELNLPSPLTDEVLSKLSSSTDFLRATIREYAIWAQKPLPSNKIEHKAQHKPVQHIEHKPVQQVVVSKCYPYIPNIASIGMGSLFERTLWRVAPKRACIMALRRSGMVDANYYRQEYPDVAQAGVDPVYHYVHFGAQEGRNPVSWFDSRYYLLSSPDVAANGANPFYHYLRYGHQEGRKPSAQNSCGLASMSLLDKGPLHERAMWRLDPKRACIMALRRSEMVDNEYYKKTYPDVAKAGVDPTYHYVHFGAQEGRNPAPWFDTVRYVKENFDVAASGTNPFYHYLRYGCTEGRACSPLGHA